MEWGQSKLKQTVEWGQELVKGSGLGRQNGRQANKACRTGTAGKHSQRILRSAQASKQTDGPQLAGLAAKTTAADDVGLSPCR